jgi:hypothetical protein
VIRRAAPALVALAALVAIAVVLFASGRDDASERLVETGVVVAVESAGLADVRGFTLRTSDGRAVDFRVGRLENEAQFPPSHLGTHLGDAVPVRVTFLLVGAERVAIRLEDAILAP